MTATRLLSAVICLMTHFIMNAKKTVERLIAVAAALLLWQAAAMLLSHFLFPTPIAVAARLFSILGTADSYGRLLYSFLSFAGGFLSGLVCGAALAVLAAKKSIIESLLWPFMLTVKSVPVVSFIILAYLYLSAADIPILIAFLIVLPVVYNNILTGLRSTDKKLSQMATVFSLSPSRKFLYITLPQIKPYLISCCWAGIGLAFKSGVAAEVITLAGGSVGEQLYQSKLFLDTDYLFAWTLLVVIMCYGFEWLFLFALRKIFAGLERL